MDTRIAERLGLPAPLGRPDPREPRELGLTAEDEVAKRARREVGGRDAVARVAAGPRETPRRVDTDRRPPGATPAGDSLPGGGDFRVDAEQVAHASPQVLDNRSRRRGLTRRSRA